MATAAVLAAGAASAVIAARGTSGRPAWQQPPLPPRRRPSRRAVLVHAEAGEGRGLLSTLFPFSGSKSQRRAGAVVANGKRPLTATEAARAYYDAYNAKDITRVLELIAPDCVYEDLVHQEPFVGRQAIAAYFDQIERLVPKDIQFCVEDITEGDPRRCGVRWHVEITDDRGQQVEFPFSRGVSFYEVNEAGQIVFARDIVEPAIKPGNAALQGIGVVAPLVRKLGPNANPAVLSTLPLGTAAMLAFYFGYIFTVMFSPEGVLAPGPPAWQTPPEALQSVLNQSFNFAYINIGLAQLGLNPVPCVAEHPVSEALFNIMNMWSAMWWPVMLADPKGARVPNRFPLWLGTFFLTNVFFPVYMALRLRPDASQQAQQGQQGQQGRQGQRTADAPALPAYAPLIGGAAAAVGLFSLGWAAAARPELAGGLAERWDYFQTVMLGAQISRIDWAFCVDAGLYSIWQAWLLGACCAPAAYRFVPFAGLAAWLVAGGPREGGGSAVERQRQ